MSRHGRVRPGPAPASSTKPYLASCRKWKEHVFGGSPMSSPAWVAVSGPSSRSASSSARRTGWVMARMVTGSVSWRGSLVAGPAGRLPGCVFFFSRVILR